MKLAKLEIQPLPKEMFEKISVLFNPNSYSIVKPVTWSQTQTSTEPNARNERKKNAPSLTFGGGGSRQLTLELFFDVTEPIDDKKIVDVREKTNLISKLTRINRDLGQPPVCEISWGTAPIGSDFPFLGVVTNLTQHFTLFRADGTPVRANMTVAFTEYLDPEKDQKDTDPEFTTRLVKRSDSLSTIAAEVYRDPTLWRPIAEANDLDDPRQLPIGLRLAIPKLG